MNPLIVIPTYVSTRLKPRAATPVSTFDHLTPLHKEGELGRCLDSLRKVRGLGQIAVIVLLAASAPSASTISQMAQIYHRDAKYANAINVTSILLCIVTMPLIVALFQM